MFLITGIESLIKGRNMKYKLNRLILKEITESTGITDKSFLTFDGFCFYFFCVNIKLKHALFVPLKREIY